MRRVMQQSGVEVIHLGHNRAAHEITQAAIQEDVQGIAITSYQGGHLEFFKYIFDLLEKKSSSHIKLFGGGGGTILPHESDELHEYGIERIYSPEDGRKMGLQGMINDLLKKCDYALPKMRVDDLSTHEHSKIGRAITLIENDPDFLLPGSNKRKEENIWGITGTGGAGKSSLVDEVVLRYLEKFKNKTVAILSVDPSKRKTGGALLGDRIRMNAIDSPRVFMRSMATRAHHQTLSTAVEKSLGIFQSAGFDLIILETSGIGQSDSRVADLVSYSTYVMTPEYGAATQLEKIDMLDFADHVVINKSDKKGAEDALRDVQKQYRRSHGRWERELSEMPVFPTVAAQYNDPGVHNFFDTLMTSMFKEEYRAGGEAQSPHPINIIPPARSRYLAEIAETIRKDREDINQQSELASQWYNLEKTMSILSDDKQADLDLIKDKIASITKSLSSQNQELISSWDQKKIKYGEEKNKYKVRDRDIEVENYSVSLSHLRIPKIALPAFRDWGDLLRWHLLENLPGYYPFTAGVFPYKRRGEDPTRMFAGEGGPERTNRRFHYVSQGMDAKRLSTAFDSVTLYGEDPDTRPDIYGKIGNSGVSICSLDDAKKLYSGFDLCSPSTSVSMTINGPAATICAFFLNAAVDQQCEKYIIENNLENLIEEKLIENYDNKNLERPRYMGDLPPNHDGLGLRLLGISGDEILEPEIYREIKSDALTKVRGTVQADILKEDQAQNTCIFSTEFSLKLMGDMQAYFIEEGVRNFYSVSISGYHIAEAGANPVTQLAFTLANGFTYVEYYLNRGMHIDAFAPNLSFFFSNGVDPEYAVIGRVARRIWAKAMKLKYGANTRSQKLKYHIQTSGRSLHAQEIDFNDIRTTLQALYAINDHCNSLHTNAYDEAITTPTEESVRRALAIQLIINHELGLSKNENPNQGSFIIEYLTHLVEDAVLEEFDRISSRGGVLGAMEKMYQRSKIQEESLYYESLKHNGELPIVGVNMFLKDNTTPNTIDKEVIRATVDEKEAQIKNVLSLHSFKKNKSINALEKIKKIAISGKNIFEELMETVKHCSLGQITNAMYEVGGEYRRNM